MTQAQIKLYWREWQDCAKVRKARGLGASDANRHALHVEALGVDVSMKVLTQRQFDRVLAKFRSFSRPDDIDAQLRAEDAEAERRSRALEDIADLAEAAGVKGGLKGVSRYFQRWLKGRPVEDLDFRTLKVVAGMLQRRLSQLPQTTSPSTQNDDGNPF